MSGRFNEVVEILTDQAVSLADSCKYDEAEDFDLVKQVIFDLVDELRHYAAAGFWQARTSPLGIYTESGRDKGRRAREYLRSLGLEAPEPGERPAEASSHE